MGNLKWLKATADEQLGVLTARQLRRAGIPVGTGSARQPVGLRKLRYGVYLLGDSPLTWEQEIMAACLHPRHEVVASHLTAARRFGWWDTDEIHVTVRYPTRVTVEGATVHRSRDIEPGDVVRDGPLRFTSPTRTLVDLGLCLPAHEVARVVDHAIALGMVSTRTLWALRRRVGRQGRNGAAVIGDVLAHMPDDVTLAESGPEVSVVRCLLAAGLPEPIMQHEVVCGDALFRIDVAYPDAKLAIEYDGREFHGTRQQRARDRWRQDLLEAAGWSVLRLTSDDLKYMPAHTWTQDVARKLVL